MKDRKKSKPRKVVVIKRKGRPQPKLPKRGMRTKQNMKARGGRK